MFKRFLPATLAYNFMVAARDVLVAYYWGANLPVGDFFSELVLPLGLSLFIFNSLSIALVPLYLNQRKDGRAELFITRIFKASVALIGLPFILLALLSGSHDYPGLLIYGFLAALSSIPRSALIAEGYNKRVLFAPAIAMAMAVTTMAATKSIFEVRALELNYLIAAGVEFAILFFGFRKLAPRFSLRWEGWCKEEFKFLFSQLGYVSLGMGLLNLLLISDQYIALWLGPEALAHYNYAMKIPSALNAMATAALSIFLYPRLAQSHLNEDPKATRQLLWRSLNFALLVIIPVSLMLAVFSPQLTSLAFQRGAFTSADSSSVAHLQMWFFMQLPMSILTLIATQSLLSDQWAKGLFWLSLATLAPRPLAAYWLSQQLGLVGIGSAAAVTQALTAIVLMHFAFHRLDRSRMIPDNHRDSSAA